MHLLKRKFIFHFFVAIALLVFTWGCSTQKNTLVSRNFHSITTKYNGYFNARESYREGIRQLNDAHEDNYEDVLSIFRYGSDQQASRVAGNMDVAYQKASVAIRKHSMNINGIEYNRWIDDSYYLIARSHYFKDDINLAILTFQYIIRQFETPLKYKSKIWVAKSYIKNDQYSNAQQILETVTQDISEGLLDEETKLMYNMVYADLFLQQRNFEQAIPFIEKASELAPKRSLETRLTYILAQAHHEHENYAMAQQAYKKVLKLSPDFQMAFQARINMAMAYDNDSGDSQFILTELNNMLKDNKNREFRDQIYYALAQFSMRQKKEEQAGEYYKLSLENYRGNESQKGITFLRLAEIAFGNEHYIQSAELYDSTMVYLSPEYPEYTKAGEKSTVLQKLAMHLRRIEHEDSLQHLAGLSAEKRNEVLDVIIEEIQEQARQEQIKEQERAQMRQQMARGGRSQTPGAGEGGWYFYNPSAISFGRNEFYAKWGERELEDLWRISNKRVMAFGDTGDMVMDESEQDQPGGAITRASLLKNVPTTPEQMQESNKQMANAYYNAGMVFKQKLKMPSEAIEYFENLVSRFPENENRLLSAYFLYDLYTQAGNTTQSNIYKNIIIQDFPDTDFAKILSDPGYRERINSRQNEFRNLYQKAYNAYTSEDYSLAMSFVEQSQKDSLTSDLPNDLAARFSFLKALILARTSTREKLVEQLTYVKENFTQTEVHEPANNLLAYLESGAGATMLSSSEEIEEDNAVDNIRAEGLSPESAVFSYKPDAVHFYVMVINTKDAPIRELRNEVNTFNREKFEDDNLNLSTLFFDQNRQLITITNFSNAEKALLYGEELISEMHKKDYSKEAIQGFAISVENYPVFYQERKLEAYLEFFNYSYSVNE